MEELSERVNILEALVSKLVKWTHFVPDDKEDVGTTNKENSPDEKFQNYENSAPISYHDSDQIDIEDGIKVENDEEEMITNDIPSYEEDEDKSSEYGQSTYNDPLGDIIPSCVCGPKKPSAYRKEEKPSRIFTGDACPPEEDEVTIIDGDENEDVILCDDEIPSTSQNIRRPTRIQFISSRSHKKVKRRKIRTPVTALESEVVTCPVCNKGLKSKHSLKMHLFTIHHAEAKFECVVCQEKFMVKEDLDQHRIHGCTPVTLKCANCPLMFRKHVDLYTHIRTDHPELSYPCPHCDKTFARRYNLARHERTHREITFEHKCSVCLTKFAKMSGLKVHLKGHELEHKYYKSVKSFACAHCAKEFAIKQSLQLHQTFHQNEDEKPFACGECEVRFATEALLLNHFETTKQHGKHNLRCLYCEKTFERKYNLVRHELSHTHGRRRPRNGPPMPNPAVLKAREEERLEKFALGGEESNGNESDGNRMEGDEDDSDCFIQQPYEYAY